jgi:1-acyl-sn-glycerol-3-phosphate acyltransferase
LARVNTDGHGPTPAERLRSVAAMVTFFVLLAVATPFILVLLLVSLGRATDFVMERIVPMIGRLVFRTAGIRFEVRQHEDRLHWPAVFIFNHSSVVDVLSVMALGLPRARFVAKWELQYNPLFFLLGRLTGQIFIRRGDSEKAVRTLHRAYERIEEQGLSILMAPEGTRKHEELIGEFKKGPFRTAMDVGYPIVPIYFEGNRKLGGGGSLFVRSGESIAHIHAPIDPSDWTLEELDDRIEGVREMYREWADAREGRR